VKKGFLLSMLFILAFACKRQPCTVIPSWKPYDESAELAANANHPSKKMQYKLIQSKLMDKNEIWKIVSDQLCDFTEEKYQALKPFILEQDIPTIQSHIKSGVLTY
jgi:amidase